jgi:hypothetical protein
MPVALCSSYRFQLGTDTVSFYAMSHADSVDYMSVIMYLVSDSKCTNTFQPSTSGSDHSSDYSSNIRKIVPNVHNFL